MRSVVYFLVEEIKDLINREPPYTEKFIQRALMALRQSLNIIETHEESRDTLLAEIARLEKVMRIGPQRRTDRNKAIAHAFKHGDSCGDIAKRYQISRQRVHAIVVDAKKRGVY